MIRTLLFVVSSAVALVSVNAVAADATAKGSFSAAFSSWGKKSVSGDWKVVKEGGKTYLELADNFVAKSGPDVKFFLSPTAADKVTGTNATNGSVFLVQLDKYEGKMRIEIPSSVDLSKFKSVVVHCEEYSKLWGTSPL